MERCLIWPGKRQQYLTKRVHGARLLSIADGLLSISHKDKGSVLGCVFKLRREQISPNFRSGQGTFSQAYRGYVKRT